MLNLNLSTILLQMANFFILAFILYRFLFKPLQNVLKKREKETIRRMDEAEEAKKEANQIRQRYEEKSNNIDAEIAARKNEARIVIEQTRQQMLQEVQDQVEKIRTQTEDSLNRLQLEAVQQNKEKIGNLASDFVKGMLSDVMRPELHQVYQEEFLNKIKDMDFSEFLEDIPSNEETFIRVILAKDPSPDYKEKLSNAIEHNLSRQVRLDFEINPGLIAGGIVRFENELIDGSLQGQVKHFQQRYQEIA